MSFGDRFPAGVYHFGIEFIAPMIAKPTTLGSQRTNTPEAIPSRMIFRSARSYSSRRSRMRR